MPSCGKKQDIHMDGQDKKAVEKPLRILPPKIEILT
jgi:hypothetical protein